MPSLQTILIVLGIIVLILVIIWFVDFSVKEGLAL